jgi:hypothetical protein
VALSSIIRALCVYLLGVSTLVSLVTTPCFHSGANFIDHPAQTRNAVPRIGFAFDRTPYFKAVPEIRRLTQRSNVGHTVQEPTSGPQVFCSDTIIRVGFEVLTAVVMDVSVFWDTASYSLYVKRRFEGTYQLHLQGMKSPSKKPERCR